MECPHDHICVLVENLDQNHKTAPARCLFASTMLLNPKKIFANLTVDEANEQKRNDEMPFGWVLAMVFFLIALILLIWNFKESILAILRFGRFF